MGAGTGGPGCVGVLSGRAPGAAGGFACGRNPRCRSWIPGFRSLGSSGSGVASSSAGDGGGFAGRGSPRCFSRRPRLWPAGGSLSSSARRAGAMERITTATEATSPAAKRRPPRSRPASGCSGGATAPLGGVREPRLAILNRFAATILYIHKLCGHSQRRRGTTCWRAGSAPEAPRRARDAWWR